MTLAGTRNFIDVPSPEVRRGGVVSVARVIDVTDPHDLMGAQYESQACASGTILEGLCADHTGKTFDSEMTWVTGDPFIVYTGVSCDMMRLEEGERKVRERFGYIESGEVDQGVLTDLAAMDVEVGPVAAQNLDVAVGILEATMAAAYGGVATLFIPINLVTQGCREGIFARQSDGTILTCQGSKVANMAAWDGTLSSTSHRIYAGGQVTLLRGPLGVFSAPSMTDGGGVVHPPRTLGERVYVPLIECVVFSALAKSNVTA
jgi:hypothetical protein